MTTLGLTLDTDFAAVVLTVGSAPAGPVTITRTDANGTNPVRLREDQEPIAGSMIVQDYEAALTGTLAYELVDSAAAVVTASTSLNMAGTLPRVASVQLPSLAATPEYVTGYEANAGTATVVHWPVDRGDPVILQRPARTREGRLTTFAGSYADALAAARVAAPGSLLMLRQPDHPGMDMYFVSMEARVIPEELLSGGWVWTTDIGYVEVKAPAVPLLGSAGWSFDDVTAGYASFSAVRAAFDDFAALTIGPPA